MKRARFVAHMDKLVEPRPQKKKKKKKTKEAM